MADHRMRDKGAALKHHLDETWPLTTDDFLAKEHLWRLGEDVEVNRQNASFTFMELCFPAILPSKNPTRKFMAIQREELGLVVMPREEVGFPAAPPELMLGMGSVSDRVLSHISDWRRRRARPIKSLFR